ncbi:MAG: nucleotidyltransferase domain-containing protein [Thermoplasmatota archaeon]
MGPDPALLKEALRFRERLARKLGSVEAVVLFGSRARGDVHPDSDTDFIVVSAAFDGKDFFERASLARHEWPLSSPVDILCYTPAEFDELRHQVSIVSVALEEGIRIGA